MAMNMFGGNVFDDLTAEDGQFNTITVDEDALISGDLTVSGTIFGSVSVDSIEDADSTTTITTQATAETIIFTTNSLVRGQFKSNGDFNLSTGGAYQINDIDILNNLTLGSSVINSSLTNLGTLTSLTMGGNIVMGTNDITGATNITATNLTGTLQTVAQPNITSVGTLTTLIMGGNIGMNNNNINSANIITATTLSTTNNQNAGSNITNTNTNAGTASAARLVLTSNSGSMALSTFSSGFTTSGSKKADGVELRANSDLSGGLSLVVEAAASMRFYTGGSADGDERMTIDSGGDINIITGDIKIQSGGLAIGNFTPLLDISIGDADTGLNQQGDGELAIYTNNVERMRIDNGGLVGIANTNPLFPLDVVGDINISTQLRIAANVVLTATTLGTGVVNSSLTNVGTLTGLTVATTGTAQEDLMTFGGTSDSANLRRMGYSVRTTTLSGDTHNWRTLTGTGIMTWDNATTEKMRITSSLTTISQALTVSGGDFIVNTNDLVVDISSGNVGIGIAAPISAFHLYCNDAIVDGTGGLTIEQDGTGDAILQFLITQEQRWVMGIDNSDSDKFKIASTADLNSNAHLIIDTSGNVDFSGDIDLVSGNTYNVNSTAVLGLTTLGSGVINSSLTNVGTLTALRVDGDIGINVSPSGLGGGLLHIHSTSGTTGAFTQYTNATTGTTTNDGFNVGVDSAEQAELRMRENADIRIYTNNVERMNIQAFGAVNVANNLLVGAINNVNPSVDLAIVQLDKGLVHIGTDILGVFVQNREVAAFQSVNGTGASIAEFSSSDPNIECIIFGDGDIENTNGNYGMLSDSRIKENISNAGSQWDDIKAIQFKKYSLIREDTDTATKIGVLAQELELVSPNLVKTGNRKVKIRNENGDIVDDEGEYKSVKQSIMFMKGLVALQEAQTRIETLETTNQSLLDLITSMSATMTSMNDRITQLETNHP